ncbi:MAG: hypothetical protein JOZ81_04940 [Chloroflexi bacterium]|nr:hypothetical protein [Chloroflexota bacterium]MBV9545454.1 hypothetical protein [Chloroflexota bacterium]
MLDHVLRRASMCALAVVAALLCVLASIGLVTDLLPARQFLTVALLIIMASGLILAWASREQF